MIWLDLNNCGRLAWTVARPLGGRVTAAAAAAAALSGGHHGGAD